jgi:hypothetical protein
VGSNPTLSAIFLIPQQNRVLLTMVYSRSTVLVSFRIILWSAHAASNHHI